MGQILSFDAARLMSRSSNVLPFVRIPMPRPGTWGRLMNARGDQSVYGWVDAHLPDDGLLIQTTDPREAPVVGHVSDFVPDDAPSGEAA